MKRRVEIERTAISKALAQAPNITQAARDLGASRRTLQNRMRDYDMPPGEAGRPRELLPVDRASSSGDLALLGVVALGAAGVYWAWKHAERVSADQKTADLRGLDILCRRR